MRILYHATTKENAMKIIGSHCIRPGMDGLVYMADSPENAIKFQMPYHEVMASGNGKFTITVIPIRIKKADEAKVIETFDHNKEYFKCKSYGYEGEIPLEMLGNPTDYTYTVNREGK